MSLMWRWLMSNSTKDHLFLLTLFLLRDFFRGLEVESTLYFMRKNSKNDTIRWKKLFGTAVSGGPEHQAGNHCSKATGCCHVNSPSFMGPGFKADFCSRRGVNISIFYLCCPQQWENVQIYSSSIHTHTCTGTVSTRLEDYGLSTIMQLLCLK